MDVFWRPFELHPDTPKGGIPIEQYFPEPRLSGMKAHLRAFAKSFGIEDLETAPRLSNTRRVLAVAEWARDEGKLDAVRDAAFAAYWRKHQGVETDEEVRAIARAAGLDEDAAVKAAEDPALQARIDAHAEEGRRRGVSGIPTWFIGPYRVVGCQPFEVLAQAVEAAGGKKRS